MALVGMVAAGMLAASGPALAADCGSSDRITIADMTWLSGSALAHITHKILTAGYGCNAELVPGDTVPTGTSMLTKSKPDIAPEFWVSTAASIWKKMAEKGNVYKAGEVFGSGGEEGWWIPDYIAQENPDLKSVTDLKNYAELFADPSNPDKGRLYGCPPGWACEIITNNLFKALNLEDAYELFSPGSGANLKASIARQVERKKPILSYYWGPTAVIGKYNLVRLDIPAHDPEKFLCLTDTNCANPQVSDWPVGEVVVAVVSDLKDNSPAVADYLSKMQVPNDDMSAVLAWADGEKASSEETATYFFENYEGIWSAWVPSDVASKVKAAL
jgi:glycine betaine/proline transport system substrate-binding protein